MDFQKSYGMWAAVAGLFVVAAIGIFADVSSPPPVQPSPPSGVTPVAADVVRHAIGPIPEVISKPKSFRVDESLAGIDRGHRADPAVTQVMATTDLPRTQHVSFPAAPFTAIPATGAADVSASEAAETMEIRRMMQSYLKAFNRHDTAALAAHWSDSGESIDLDSGEKTTGRDAVAGVFATLFEQDTSAAIDIDIESIRPIRDDVAVVDGVSLLSFDDATSASSRFSAVVVREAGTWVLSSVRETAVSAPQAIRRPSAQLDQLEWLVGSWEDVSEELVATTRCSWNAGRSFLTRSHISAPEATSSSTADGIPALLPADGSAREISEIIGWDPDRRQIRSWVFTSDGRFAEGVWSRTSDSWEVRYEGRGADEGTACTFTISRPGPDEIVIRCEPSSLTEILPPATDFVRTAYLGG
jgi:uncharacterized protein (TIGR02246 family)